MKHWIKVRDELSPKLSIVKSNHLPTDDLNFRFGKKSDTAIIFKYGIIGIDRDDLLVLGIKQSIPQDLGIKIIKVLTQYCENKK